MIPGELKNTIDSIWDPMHEKIIAAPNEIKTR